MAKIRVAFIKFGGLSAGGTEKFLQNIAANLDRNEFVVDYYYCDSSPYIGSNYLHANTDKNRVEFMNANNVNLIKFNVGFKDVNSYTHNWINTDFWEKFNEMNYDIIQTGRAGHPEYPFFKIHKTPIVDSIHIVGGIDNQKNISRVMHISNWSAERWVKMGGDPSRVVVVSHPMDIKFEGGDYRNDPLFNDKFIFGFHQRNDNDIFSPIPLAAYSKIETPQTAFFLLGGSELYRRQAKELGIRNIKFLDHTGDSTVIYKFLNTLHVYSHGRKDGEVNSTAMAEAMYFGLPIVSHYSNHSNGHVECIGEAGLVVETWDEYANELNKLLSDKNYYKIRSQNAKRRFDEHYNLKNQIEKIEKIYKDVVKNPFPNKIIRIYSHLLTRVKIVLARRSLIIIFRKLRKAFSL